MCTLILWQLSTLTVTYIECYGAQETKVNRIRGRRLDRRLGLKHVSHKCADPAPLWKLSECGSSPVILGIENEVREHPGQTCLLDWLNGQILGLGRDPDPKYKDQEVHPTLTGHHNVCECVHALTHRKAFIDTGTHIPHTHHITSHTHPTLTHIPHTLTHHTCIYHITHTSHTTYHMHTSYTSHHIEHSYITHNIDIHITYIISYHTTHLHITHKSHTYHTHITNIYTYHIIHSTHIHITHSTHIHTQSHITSYIHT